MGERVTRYEMRRAARRRKQLFLAGGALAVVAAVVAANFILNPPASVTPPVARQCGTIVMPQGEITILFYPDLVPTTTARFSGLFAGGYYNGLPWHRVESWVIQTGNNPNSPRDPIPLELNPSVHNVRGSVGAARTTDPNSATTQFYILKADQLGLDTEGGGYSIFGTVLSGMPFVDAMQANEVITRSALVPCP